MDTTNMAESNGNDHDLKKASDSDQPVESSNFASQEMKTIDDEDDLEEGELKDDDDDDDDDDNSNKNGNKSDDEASRLKTSSSEEESPKRPASSSSSSSSSTSSSPAPSSDSKGQSSSKSSSRIGSHQSSSSKNNSSIFEKYQTSRLSSSRRLSEDRYRIRDRDRETEDPSEKAAKLISMRTRLLEARSREIELKFQKNKVKLSSPPSPLLSPTIDQKNVKMTVTKPSIPYSENPNAPPFVESIAATDEKEKEIVEGIEIDKEKEKKKIKSKQKHEVKEKKQKKKLKKKKKNSSSKKRKKSKSNSSPKKLAIEPKPETPPELDLPLDNNKASIDHQGPRTPPDNHVMTLDDEQIEWPSHLIKTTLTQPSITYSVNPDSVIDPTNEDAKRVSKRRKSNLTSPVERKRYKIDERYMSVVGSSPPCKTVSAFTLKADEDQLNRKYSHPRPYETDLNFDYRWYYNYFVNSLEMDHNQAQHQAYYAIISAGSYEQEALDRWLISKGFNRQSSPICDGQKPLATPTLEEVIASRYESRHSQEEKDANALENQESSSAETAIKTEDENSGGIEKPHEKLVGAITLRPLKPEITIVKSQREIVLPNGQVLPPGTIQKVVHPYPKLDSELLGPYFDFF